MAKFVSSNRKDGIKQPSLKDNVVLMNDSGTVNFCFSEARVGIFSDDGQKISSYLSQRAVVRAPDGAQVLPYFIKNGIWYVVFVEQFRIAIDKQTLECAGGEIHSSNIEAVMAQELEEEAKVKIDPQKIEIVLCELIQPSILNGKAYGGIIEIDPSIIPDSILGGEWEFGEYTVLIVKPLLEMLKLRDSRRHNLDLWSSRLLDEVAKKVGLLKKCY